MSKFICALAFLTGLLVLSTPCFATTATTSTACAVNIDDGDVADPTASPVHLSQINPVGCSFSGTSPGATYDIYSVSASSSAGSASGGLTGSLRTGEVQASASLDTVSIPTSMSPFGTLSASENLPPFEGNQC